MQEYVTEQEFIFNNPSRVYLCFHCGRITNNRDICTNCGLQANDIFQTGWRVKIADKEETIFMPVEQIINE